jgi:hypothetical protein
MAISKWVAPSVEQVASGDSEANKELQVYLQRFGYLDPFRDPADIDPEIGVAGGLAKLQRFCGLPASGTYDKQTERTMNQPRCGIPDTGVIPRFALQGSRWDRRIIKWCLKNNTMDLPIDDTKEALRAAFLEWDRHMDHNSLVKVSGHPNILVKFARGAHGDGDPFDGAGNVLAHALFPPLASGFLAGDVHFDEDETWTKDFLMKVALHEIGHSLGLAHSNDPQAVMYPFFTGRSTLSPDDKAAIRTLYP